jgi:hypothetical protein
MDEQRTLRDPRKVLSQFLHLLAIRRHVTVEAISYDDMFQHHPEVFQTFVVEYVVTKQTSTGSTTTVETCSRDMLDLLINMKLNVEDVDWCTLERQEIFDAIKPLRYRVAHPLALAMQFFGSREFLTALKDLCLSHQGAVSYSDVHRFIRTVLVSIPLRVFTCSYNPNYIRRCQVRRARAPLRVVRRLWNRHKRKHLSRVPLFENSRHCSKRHFLSALGRRMGPFTGKCYYQVLRQALPCVGALSRQRRGRQRSRADQYTECGPGAREAINSLEALPHGWNIRQPGQSTADAYSNWAVKWLRIWRKEGKSLAADERLESIKANILYFIEAGCFCGDSCHCLRLVPRPSSTRCSSSSCFANCPSFWPICKPATAITNASTSANCGGDEK